MSEAKIVAIKSSDLIAIGVCYTFALCWAFFGLCFGRAVEVLGAVCVAEMVGAFKALDALDALEAFGRVSLSQTKLKRIRKCKYI